MKWMMLVLAGCGGRDPDDPASDLPPEGDPLDPSPWSYTPDEPGDDGVDLDAMGRALDAAVLEVLTIDARTVLDPYLATYAQSSTATCPPTTTDGDGNLYWQGSCDAPDGARFGGYLSHFVFRDFVDVDFVLQGDTLTGVVTVTNAAGDTLDLEGDAQWLTGLSHDGTTELAISIVNGGFAWDGPSPTWLADGRRAVSIGLTGLTIPAIDLRLVLVTGSVTPVVDGALYAVRFPDNHVAKQLAGFSDCGLEPGGSIEVRDPQGRWIDIDFHGPILDVSAGDASRCDGCGDATIDGESIGQVCATFTPWLSWEAL